MRVSYAAILAVLVWLTPSWAVERPGADRHLIGRLYPALEETGTTDGWDSSVPPFLAEMIDPDTWLPREGGEAALATLDQLGITPDFQQWLQDHGYGTVATAELTARHLASFLMEYLRWDPTWGPWKEAEVTDTQPAYGLEPGVYTFTVDPRLSISPHPQNGTLAFLEFLDIRPYTFVYLLYEGTYRKDFEDYCRAQGVQPMNYEFWYWTLMTEPAPVYGLEPTPPAELSLYYNLFVEMMASRLANDPSVMNRLGQLPSRWVASGSCSINFQSASLLSITVGPGRGSVSYMGPTPNGTTPTFAFYGDTATEWDEQVPVSGSSYALTSLDGVTLLLPTGDYAPLPPRLPRLSPITMPPLRQNGKATIRILRPSPSASKPSNPTKRHDPDNGISHPHLYPPGTDKRTCSIWNADPYSWKAIVPVKGAWDPRWSPKTEPAPDIIFSIEITKELAGEINAGVYGKVSGTITEGTTVNLPAYTILLERKRIVSYWQKRVAKAVVYPPHTWPYCKVLSYKYVWLYDEKQRQFGTTLSPLADGPGGWLSGYFNKVLRPKYERSEPYADPETDPALERTIIAVNEEVYGK